MARELPKIEYKGNVYIFDERLSELRDERTTRSMPIRRSESELISYALTSPKREQLLKMNMKDLEEQGKLKEYTVNGCVIERGFSHLSGRELGLMSDLSKRGYEELYYDAPYYWGMINVTQKKILTYTEGDIYDIKCPDKDTFYKEAKAHVDFLKDEGVSKTVYGEWPSVEEKLKKLLD